MTLTFLPAAFSRGLGPPQSQRRTRRLDRGIRFGSKGAPGAIADDLRAEFARPAFAINH
jgi:hypothetical protein